MSNWDFRAEKNQNNVGNTTTNPTGGLKAGFQPFAEADTLKSKRNVIATDKGWVRRQIKNTGNGPRIIDEVLVAANPGVAGGYAGAAYLGFPDIAQIYLTDNSNIALTSHTLANNTSYRVHVVFNEPVKHSGLAGVMKLSIANTAAGNNSLIATAAAVNSNTGIVNANNTLVFAFTSGPAGSYKIQAQTIANNTSTAANLVSLNTGSESANLVITGAVSNTVGTIIITA
jgi:hypothetical protein